MNLSPNPPLVPAQEHLLLIEPVTISLAPNFFYIFKSKEILQGQHFELKLRITNKGLLHFPGGTIVSCDITHNQDYGHPVTDKVGSKTIDSLPPSTSIEIDCGTWHAFYSGMMRIRCNVTSIDSLSLRCYQKLQGSGQLSLIQSGEWEDYIPVSSETEMQQRHTNKVLIVLTLATVIYYVLSIFIKFPLVPAN